MALWCERGGNSYGRGGILMHASGASSGHELARAWMCADPLRWLMFNFFTVALYCSAWLGVCGAYGANDLSPPCGPASRGGVFFFLAVAGAVLNGMMHRSLPNNSLAPALLHGGVGNCTSAACHGRYIKILRRVIWCGRFVQFLFCGEVYGHSVQPRGGRCLQAV